MKYVVYGAGAIGGVLAAGMHTAGDDVVAVARGAHLDAIQADGLRVDTPEGSSVVPVRAVGHPREIEWTAEEESGARALAARPAKVFATRDEAAARHLALAGLRGLASPDDAVAQAGVRQVEGGWAVALDNRAFSAVGPSVPGILRRSVAPLHLAAGEGDPMVSLAAMQRIDPSARVIAGVGHNAHWEDPAAVWSLMG